MYARVLGDSVFYTAHKALNHRLIRASKDGKKIEFVGGEDVRAVDFVVNDGWIYYADNGYVCEGNLFSFDYSRVGIYKMKTDGSEKTRISEIIVTGSLIGDGEANLWKLSIQAPSSKIIHDRRG